MNYTLKIIPEAQIDIQEATHWYNQQQEQLGDRFFIQVAETIDYIVTNPMLFPLKYKQVRQTTVSKFPFNVFYTTDESNARIFIIAVTHASRNPQIWKKRIS